ncbi:Ribosomal RNA large subunit methyltransferase I [Nymphon striatum]|nr:Ribosomal RNA large subunit methyltransferase I [Nymphon striatum]
MTQPTDSKLPIIRLKPKANARALRRGFPWVYDNELVTDRRTKSLTPGTIAILEDSERTQMGLVGVTPGSRLIARMLDRDVTATIDAAWLYAKLKYALELRETLFDTPFYRLIHAEADGLPGVIIDRFGATFVIQPNAAWADALIEQMCAALVDLTGAGCVIKNSGGRGRALEGLDDVDVVLHGTPPSEPIPVAMNGAIYMADVMGGQKTAMSAVLDLQALGAGAASALCVDGSAPALALAEQGAAKMDMSSAFSMRKADAFDALTELGAEGSSFDIVVCDPPASSAPASTGGKRLLENTGLSSVKALLDTCVLYPTVMREMLLGAARSGAFEPFWSERILGEWERAAVKLGPTGAMQASGEIALLKSDWPKASVSIPQALEKRLMAARR